jgi:pilus assembly protein CpaB
MMDRPTRHIVVMSIAIGTAAAASFGVYRAVARTPAREVEAPRKSVVVAVKSLPTGVRLSAADVRLAPWPADIPVTGSFSDIDAVVNRALLASVVENEPLVQAKLARADAGAGLSPAIPPGMRAMAVKVNEVIGVAGFLDPGTRVDLLVTIRGREESRSRTVVSNLQVLGAGTRSQQASARDENAAPPIAAVVTLLVTPEDAERIALAQTEGQIVLVLRNPLDSQPTQTVGVRSASLFPAPVEPAAPVATPPRPRRPPAPVAAATPAPAPTPAPKPYLVEAIRAAKRSEEEVVR